MRSHRYLRLISAVLAVSALLGMFCTAVFAAMPTVGRLYPSYEYEFGLSEAEFARLMENVINGIMWYFITGVIIGVIAVIIGLVVIFREKSRRNFQGGPDYGQYPPRY